MNQEKVTLKIFSFWGYSETLYSLVDLNCFLNCAQVKGDKGWLNSHYNIGDALRNLVSFVQFKKRENIHWGVSLLVNSQASSTQSISY